MTNTYEIDVFQTVRPAVDPTVRWAATVHDPAGRVVAASGPQDGRQAAIDTATHNVPAAV
ncbi:hypothetical protein [Streptomyces sp. BA2]|uniref:hypothetical protein n=1 Tax=Streptomyces sp. BA2 TaxID=436595 RepID=UPI0013297ED8|nr:hypothetical protein [Streptomyces sp. BA2]MWA08777.1 hypothetical protein [Streptomyces sp. BA2]